MKYLIYLILIIFLKYTFLTNLWGQNYVKELKSFETDNYQKNLNELTLMAKKGDAEAQSTLGFIYYWGFGTSQDYDEALKWYSLSAQQGYPEAQYALGNMYGLEDYGEGDFVFTHMWWNISSSNGYDEAKRGLRMIEQAMPLKDIEKAKSLADICMKNDYIECSSFNLLNSTKN